MRSNMKKLDLIRCIKQGFIDGTNDRLNEDNEDYEESCTTLDIVGIEAQYSYEFGLMMAREEMDIEEEEMDGYLEQILYDSDSSECLLSLV
jgi:hypothetical protein